MPGRSAITWMETERIYANRIGRGQTSLVPGRRPQPRGECVGTEGVSCGRAGLDLGDRPGRRPRAGRGRGRRDRPRSVALARPPRRSPNLVRRQGGRSEVLMADLADRDAGDRLVDEAWSTWGGLDAWLHIAGADTLTGAGGQALLRRQARSALVGRRRRDDPPLPRRRPADEGAGRRRDRDHGLGPGRDRHGGRLGRALRRDQGSRSWRSPAAWP